MKPLVYSILPRPPHPTRDGLAIRNYHLLRGLASSFRLRCFTLVPPHLAREPGEYPEGAEVVAVPQANRRLRSAGALAATALSRWPYPELLYRSADLARRVAEGAAAQEPAWVIAHSYHVGPLALESGRPAWVDFHNVESEIWHRMAATASRAGHRFFARWQEPRVLALERSLLARADGTSCVSRRDAAAFALLSPGAEPDVVLNGVDLDRYAFRSAPAASERVFFVGDLSWRPNAEAVRWFALEIWPILARLRPRADVEILGRHAPADLCDLAGVRFKLAGESGDTRPHWRDAAVAVVPLLAGGGTRLKILEAAACGVPVVSTSVGAEGLSFVNGEEILLRDDPAPFAEAVAGLLADPEARHRQAGAARARVEREYGWRSISERFAGLLERRTTGR
jgi:glycosyltransferase involved in cell wall biosynthesis